MASVRREQFDVAVTGLGLVTPAGIGVDANWERVCTGVSTATYDPELADQPVDFSCRIPGFDPAALVGRSAWRLDRVGQIAMVATREAVADAGLDPETWDGARVGVVVGSALGGITTFVQACRTFRTFADEGPQWVSPLLMVMFPVNMIAGYVAIDCNAGGPNLVTSTACASGPTAIGTARQLLQSGMCDVVLAGGSEASLTPITVAGFDRMGALSHRRDDPVSASRPFDVDRDGFVIAEAAGMLVLERVGDAHARGARIRAKISGFGASADAHHASAPDPTGAGVERAIRMALADAGIRPADVDHVNAHGTSTPRNDVHEARVLRRVLGDRAAVTSTKDVTGHALGAAGAIEAAYTVLAVEHGVVPPTANLNTLDPAVEVDVVAGEARPVAIRAATTDSFGFGGQNAVLVITAA